MTEINKTINEYVNPKLPYVLVSITVTRVLNFGAESQSCRVRIVSIKPDQYMATCSCKVMNTNWRGHLFLIVNKIVKPWVSLNPPPVSLFYAMSFAYFFRSFRLCFHINVHLTLLVIAFYLNERNYILGILF